MAETTSELCQKMEEKQSREVGVERKAWLGANSRAGEAPGRQIFYTNKQHGHGVGYLGAHLHRSHDLHLLKGGGIYSVTLTFCCTCKKDVFLEGGKFRGFIFGISFRPPFLCFILFHWTWNPSFSSALGRTCLSCSCGCLSLKHLSCRAEHSTVDIHSSKKSRLTFCEPNASAQNASPNETDCVITSPSPSPLEEPAALLCSTRSRPEYC